MPKLLGKIMLVLHDINHDEKNPETLNALLYQLIPQKSSKSRINFKKEIVGVSSKAKLQQPTQKIKLKNLTKNIRQMLLYQNQSQCNPLFWILLLKKELTHLKAN